MHDTLWVGIDLAHKNLPQARWNHLAARLRRMGARQIGGLFEFDDADPAQLESWLQDELEPWDRYVIRVVLPDAFLPGEGQVA